jgi:hypothetical protein
VSDEEESPPPRPPPAREPPSTATPRRNGHEWWDRRGRAIQNKTFELPPAAAAAAAVDSKRTGYGTRRVWKACDREDAPRGLRYALEQMPVGQHATITLAPEKAFGATGSKAHGVPPDSEVVYRAAKESEIPNFKGSYLDRFPLVLADFWTSDHLSERSRRVDAFYGTRARGTLTLKRR